MVLAVDAQIDILNSVFFVLPSTSKIFQTVSPTISRQVGDHTDFVQEEPQGPQMVDQDFGHLCRGRRTHISGHSGSGIFSTFGASSILT